MRKNQNVTENSAVKENSNRVGLKIVLTLILISLFVGIGMQVGIGSVEKLNTISVKNIFADVNGDGILDFIVKAEIVLNADINANL